MNTGKYIQKAICLYGMLSLAPSLSSGQYRIRSVEKIEGFKSIPSETVFVHYNDPLLLAGEYLYYKMYCLERDDLTPSPISKIGYVELLGKGKNLVFRHKIPLRSGMGQGDFFIPTTVPTGNYKLMGYTRWMLNAKVQDIFMADITIINPYQELPKTKFSHREIKSRNSQNPDGTANSDSTLIYRKSPFLRIESDKTRYGKREQVSLLISTESDAQVHGNYSLSVRKKYEGMPGFKITATRFSRNSDNKKSYRVALNDSVYLPELRGELLSGRIVSKTDSTPMAHGEVSLSFFGDNPTVHLISTNSGGVFYSNLALSDRSDRAALQVLGDTKDKWRILLDSLPRPNYDNLDFRELAISPTLNPLILERSIYNQVENAYFEQKPDSTVRIDSKLPVYHKLDEKYNLDDYTRFPTLRETVVEILHGVLLRRVKGQYKFLVRSNDTYLLGPDDIPLILVDGLLLEDLSSLVAYDVKGIESIGVSRKEHYLGPKLYKGIISIKTKENDFLTQAKLDYIQQVKIDNPISLKQYYFENHDKQLNSKRIPDYRHQLFWKPNLVLNGGRTGLIFYTSDNSGEYEISLEGFTLEGKPVSMVESFLIE